VDTEGIEPMAHISGVENVMREDIVENCEAAVRDAIVAGFPAKDGDALKVKPVFE
jgi:Asp-tRNA(Asn)/Glu-tRNA(Gln) amidotransferase C subunit